MGAASGRGGLDRCRLAHRARRPGAEPAEAGHLVRGVRPGRGPGRVGIVGEGLDRRSSRSVTTTSGPLPAPILAGTELWCQGYSEPDAGSDLANVSTPCRARRRRVGRDRAEGVDLAGHLGRVVLRDRPHVAALRPGQEAPGPLVPARPHGPGGRRDPTDPSAHRHLRVQRGVLRRRPHLHRQRGRRRGNGWKVAMGTLAFERGASTLGQQLQFDNELRRVLAKAGRLDEPVLRQRLIDAWMGLHHALEHACGCSPVPPRRSCARGDDLEAVLGRGTATSATSPWTSSVPTPTSPNPSPATSSPRSSGCSCSRADTIYGGSNQIQRNLIGERALGLREPKI